MGNQWLSVRPIDQETTLHPMVRIDHGFDFQRVWNGFNSRVEFQATLESSTARLYSASQSSPVLVPGLRPWIPA